jgi:hypothetical protein
LFERAFERYAIAQHRRELLVEEGELVVIHAISNSNTTESLDKAVEN